eukprot:SAG22_NODE_11003_length_505_cov_1.253695_2_plen_84_part_01
MLDLDKKLIGARSPPFPTTHALPIQQHRVVWAIVAGYRTAAQYVRRMLQRCEGDGPPPPVCVEEPGRPRDTGLLHKLYQYITNA